MRRAHNFIDITGRTYGRWLVMSYQGKSKWLCRCTCGRLISVDAHTLRSGSSRGCGKCYAKKTIQHGMSRSPEYHVWWDMIDRCENPDNPSFDNYGGRGITVCKKWHDILQFLADMGNRPSDGYSIERLDNDLGYSPDNCEWATAKQQSRNTRANVRLVVNGEERTIVEWAEIMMVRPGLIGDRIDAGWPAERAVLTPVLEQKK